MRLGCSGCLGTIVGLALVAILVGGTVGAIVRMLADPAIAVPATTPADGARAQRKLFDLGRPRTGETVFTEAEINALLARHLVEARYGCGECHGRNFGGGVMIDNPAIGRLLGPNLTTGKGSVTSGFRISRRIWIARSI